MSVGAKDRDRYGRVVAVCLADGNDINGWMVAEGWALGVSPVFKRLRQSRAIGCKRKTRDVARPV